MTPIATALGDVRTRTGLTDEELARVVGVRQATFTRWRNGTMRVADRHAHRLASLLGEPMSAVNAMLAHQEWPAPAIEKGTIGWLLRQFERRLEVTAQDGAEPKSRAQLAYEHLNVDISTYHKWRKNQVVPAPQVIAHLAAGLGVPEQTVVMAVYRTELSRLAQKGS